MERLFQELRENLAKAVFLKDKPRENPDSTLRALWFAAAKQPRAVQRFEGQPLPLLDSEGADRLRELIGKRLAGVPLAHLTGREEFMGVELITGPEALIPRRETELLGERALEILGAIVKENQRALMIDVCAGSGNLALALAWHEPNCRVSASDIEEEAIGLARKNAKRLGLEERIRFSVGDLFAPFEPAADNRVDLIVANPPYISSQRLGQMPEEIAGHEPHAAFDGGPFGISVVARLIADAPRFLKPGAWMCMEVGLGQAKGLAAMLVKDRRYCDVRTAKDEAGDDRVLLARAAQL